MLGLPTALPTLEELFVWSFVSCVFGTGLCDGFLKRNRWHYPEFVAGVLTKAYKMIFGANPASLLPS